MNVAEALLAAGAARPAAVAACAVASVSIGGLVRVGAHVVLRAGVPGSVEPLAPLRRHVVSRLPAHTAPARITFCTALPRTPSGKVRRTRLRQEPPA